MACCLCQCGLDCADRTLFFEADRIQELQELPKDKDKDKNSDDNQGGAASSSLLLEDFTLDDPYVPLQAYDPHNALVYCDGCSRLYHQKCHFVPLFILPRGKWYCLLCTTHNSHHNHKKGHAARRTPSPKATTTALTPSVTVYPFHEMFQSPPNPSVRQQEQEWEHQTGTIQAKQWFQQLTQIRQFCKTQASNIRLASAQLETFTSIPRNRQHLITLCHNYFRRQQQQQQQSRMKRIDGDDDNNNDNKTSHRRFVVSSSSQQLADTLVKLTTSQWKIRTLLMSLERYQHQANHILPNSLLQWVQQLQQQPPPLPPSSSSSCNNNNNINNNINNNFHKVMTYLFPHGQQVYLEYRRTIPRTAEWKGDEEIDKDGIKEKGKGEAMMAPPTLTATAVTDVIATSTRRTTMVPMEISIPDSPRGPSSSTQCLPVNASPRSNRRAPMGLAITTKPPQLTTQTVKSNNSNVRSNQEDSDSSGVSLDDLQCCICQLGDATDENDLLLCDGQGCCRAFHMSCVWPPITLDDVEGKETEDWFCPLCQALPNMLAELQEACMDEEWVYRKEQRRSQRGKKQTSPHKRNKDDDSNTDSTSSSIESWNGASDVFPEAEWQMNASKLLKMSPQQPQQQQQEGVDDIGRLLERFLGPDFLPSGSSNNNMAAASSSSLFLPMGSDSEDENEYSLFDEASFEERKRRRRLEAKTKKERTNSMSDVDGDDDDEAMSASSSSTQSSDATLQEMSSVELEIDRTELEALSDGNNEDDDDDNNDDASSSSSLSSNVVANRRVSKRLRRKKQRWSHGGDSDSGSGSLDAGRGLANSADFDASNIVYGKRRRTAVDYRKLNDALFGDLTQLEQAKLDDQVDYEERRRDGGTRKKKGKTTTKG